MARSRRGCMSFLCHVVAGHTTGASSLENHVQEKYFPKQGGRIVRRRRNPPLSKILIFFFRMKITSPPS